MSQHLAPSCCEPPELCLPRKSQQISELPLRDITDAVAIGLRRAQNCCAKRQRVRRREREGEGGEKGNWREKNSKRGSEKAKEV